MSTTNERPTPETYAYRGTHETHRVEGMTIYERAEKLERERDEAKAYAEKCRDGCISLSHSLDRIDYACGQPNEMGVSEYCVHQNDEAVVARVKEMRTNLDRTWEKLKATRRELAAANKGAERCSHINNSLAVSLHEVRETLRNAEAELSVATAERDDFRRQIQSSSINTNVRLFDLVRHQRAALHEDELITDEEYAWLCGSEMAMSPQGGSPSPRRLEDYDRMRGQLEAMREAIKEAAKLVQDCANRCSDATIQTHSDDDAKGALDDTIEWSESALAKLRPLLQ